jgi:hypothetical protein
MAKSAKTRARDALVARHRFEYEELVKALEASDEREKVQGEADAAFAAADADKRAAKSETEASTALTERSGDIR